MHGLRDPFMALFRLGMSDRTRLMGFYIDGQTINCPSQPANLVKGR